MVTPQTSPHRRRMTSETASVNPEQHGGVGVGGWGGFITASSLSQRGEVQGMLYVCVNIGEAVNTFIKKTRKKSGIFRIFSISAVITVLHRQCQIKVLNPPSASLTTDLADPVSNYTSG